MTFVGAAVQMYKPLKQLSQIHLKLEIAAPGAERVFSVLETESVISDNPVAIEMEEPIRDIEFKRVSFQYSDKVKVLDNVSFSLQQGECVAIVGSSGSGKSTMVNLVPRFYDTSAGSVCINNHDIRDYTLSSLRRAIGVVTQQTFLFNQSVAENISYGASDATQEDIIVAAKKANAHDFIMELDKGYDTVIGERATLLSGGMAQRLTIARALLKNPPILILDEATSSLDTESEKLVQEALDELMKDRTVLVIAHRLSTIRNADRIIVLDKGCIIEEGSHDELYAKGGSYRRLCDLQ